MSRLAAIKEYTFMQALYARSFPTPIPIDQNRHVVVMSRVYGYPLAQMQADNLSNIPSLFLQSVQILKRLVHCGLIHCDFNEFNLMITSPSPSSSPASQPQLPISAQEKITSESDLASSRLNPSLGHCAVDSDGQNTHSLCPTESSLAMTRLVMIDFPQIISTQHLNASEMFERDLNGIIKYFTMKLKYDLDDDESESEEVGEDQRSERRENETEEDKQIRKAIVESLTSRNGELITLQEVIEEYQKGRKIREKRMRERAGEQEGDAIDPMEEEDIYEEIKRRQYHGGMSHDDDRNLQEFLSHQQEHKQEMIQEINDLKLQNSEGGLDSGSESEVIDDVEGNESSEETDEVENAPQAPRTQEEIRNTLRKYVFSFTSFLICVGTKF